jgi:lysophospholipase L1-like esterase
MRTVYHDVTVTTNRLGLRSPEVEAREPGELRILLVGESGAFGIGVEDDETYAARLERILQRDRAQRVRVVNASVPAWSSFQGLKYLELRGLSLEPDVVLFSFEANDYLPASLRDSSTTEAEAVRSDRQLYESRQGAAWRRLIQRSALFRFVSYRIARLQIQRFRERGRFVAPEEIGVPEIDVTPRLRRSGPGRFGLSDVPEDRLPTRVLPEERRPIFEELLAQVRGHGASLVLIHPTYQTSERHECLLTRFAAERELPLFEAWDAVHGSGAPRAETFLDFGHPSARGHELLAEGLARFLVERALLAGEN